MFFFTQYDLICFKSSGLYPPKYTKITALVFFVVLLFISSKLIQKLFSSTSANITLALTFVTHVPSAINDCTGTITSSFFFNFKDCIEISNALVHVFKKTAYLLPTKFANFFSNSLVYGPVLNFPFKILLMSFLIERETWTFDLRLNKFYI